ncbi:MAG: HlyD family efflux transporter periplasmic adaptor subunit, partial [Myxococcota bacterium]
KAAADGIAEARARTEAAEASARTAKDEARRTEELKPNGAVSDEQVARAALEAARADAEARATRLSVTRLQWEHEVSDADARTRLETVRRELARIEGETETARAHVGRLARQVDGQVIVAPITGRIAEQAPLNPGRFVAAGSHLMSVLPQGELRIVARFEPGPVFGRVRPGQPARMRLDGFPWTRFGMLGATVSRVAAETVDDEVRVELQLDEASEFAAPLQHGLPGRVEIEVDRVRPLELLLRMAGQETGS